MPEKAGVEAVDRALTLMECCLQEKDGMTLAELSRRSGYYKSTILRLAVSLESFGYLRRCGDGRFVLGSGLARMANVAALRYDLGSIVRPVLEELAAQSRETASLYVRRNDLRECLFRHEPDRAIRHIVAEGALLPLTGGASSHIIHAWSDRGLDDAGGDLPDHAISLGERDPEVAALAMPVFDAAGRFFGAVSLSGLITRFAQEEARSRLLGHLGKAAAALNSAYLTETGT